MFTIAKFRVFLVLAAGLLGTVASAATVHEDDFGSFSGHWDRPTVLDADGVSGTGRGNDFDILHLTGFAPGAQTITLRFTAPEIVRASYSAGGSVLYSTDAFRWGWDGARAGSFQLGVNRPADEVSIALGSDFDGELHLGLYFTHGRDISYDLSSSAPVTAPAPVPLPATGLLLGGALVAAGAFARRRTRG